MRTRPIPAVAVFADSIPVHQYDLNTLSANLTNLYNYDLGGFRAQKPLVTVRCTTQSVPNNADTLLVWDTVDLNYDGMWSSGATSQLTVQTAGVYRLYLQANAGNSLGTAQAVYLCVNGTSTQNNAIGTMAPGSGVISTCAAAANLSAGSTVYGFLYQNTGSAQVVRTTFGGVRMAAEWISPQ